MNQARLKDVPFFSSMSEEDLAAVAQRTDEISVAAGRVLAREGDLGEEFFVIESGTAEVTRGAHRSRSWARATSSARLRSSAKSVGPRP